MAVIRGYMGVSVDGYIAGENGDIDWLRKYDGVDFGPHAYDRFIGGIATVVMGRGTHDALVAMGEGWPYSGKRAIVVASQPLAAEIGAVEIWRRGVPNLVDYLRGLGDGDVWIVGGGQLQQAFIAASALDRLELFVVPEIVGRGIPTFPANGHARGVRLAGAEALAAGVVWLDYRFDPLTPLPGVGSP